MAQVLDLLGFEAREASGDEVRGACPVHGSNVAQEPKLLGQTSGSESIAAFAAGRPVTISTTTPQQPTKVCMQLQSTCASASAAKCRGSSSVELNAVLRIRLQI